jgi:hypothetical protein
LPGSAVTISLVVYPGAAENHYRPLPTHLTGVNQPVNRTQNGFSAPRPTHLACIRTQGEPYDITSAASFHEHRAAPVLRPSGPVATVEPERATPLVATTRGPSILPPSPVSRVATTWPIRCHSSPWARLVTSASSRVAGRSDDTPGTG